MIDSQGSFNCPEKDPNVPSLPLYTVDVEDPEDPLYPEIIPLLIVNFHVYMSYDRAISQSDDPRMGICPQYPISGNLLCHCDESDTSFLQIHQPVEIMIT